MAHTERLVSGPPTLVATVHGADGRAVVQRLLILTVNGTLILVSLLRPVVVSSASRTTGQPLLGNLRVETRWHCCSRSFPHCHLPFRLAAPPSESFCFRITPHRPWFPSVLFAFFRPLRNGSGAGAFVSDPYTVFQATFPPQALL